MKTKLQPVQIPSLTKLLALGLGLAAAGMTQPQSTFATDYTWDGGGDPDGNLGTGTNWNADSAPSPGSTNNLIFAGTTLLSSTNNYSDGDDFQDITFDSGAGAFTISNTGSNGIDWFGAINNNSSNTQTIGFRLYQSASNTINANTGNITLNSSALLFRNSQALTLSASSGITLRIDSVIADGGGAGSAISVTGGGTVNLRGANTFTSGIIIKSGALVGGVNADQSISTLFGTGAIQIGDSASGADATLRLSSYPTYANAITVDSGAGARILSTNSASSGQSPTVSGTITLNNNLTLAAESGGTLRVTGVINDGASSFGLTVDSAGTGDVRLNAANTFDGGVTIKRGSVEMQSSGNALGTGTMTIGDTTGSNNATLRTSVGLTATNAITVAAGNSGTNTIRNDSTGTTTFSGAVALNNNLRLQASNTGALAVSGSVAGGSGTNSITNAGTGTGGVSLGAVGNGTGTVAVVQDSATSMLTMNSASTFTGGLTVASGTATTNNNTGFGASGNTVTLGTGTGGATLFFQGTPSGVAQNFVVAAGGSRLITANNSATGNGVVFSTSGTITLNENLSVTETSTGNIQFRGVITGTGGIVADTANTGIVSLRAANTFSGGVLIKSGIVEQQNASAFGSGTVTIGDTSGSANASLTMAGTPSTATNAIIIAAGNTGTNSIRSTTGNSGVLTGSVALNNNLTLAANANGNITVSATGGGIIGGTGTNTITNSGTGSGSVTLGSTGPAPTVTTVSGTNDVTVSSAAGLFVGQSFGGLGGVPAGSVITAISGTTVTLSAAATSGTTAGATFYNQVSNGTGTVTVVQDSATSTLNLNSLNTFTGGLFVRSGTVSTSLGNGTNLAFGAQDSTITLGGTTGAAVALVATAWQNPRQFITVTGSGSRLIELRHTNSGQVHTLERLLTLDNADLTIRTTGASGVRIQAGVSGTGNLTVQANGSGPIDFRTVSPNFVGTITNTGTGTGVVQQGSAISFGANITSLIQNSTTSLWNVGQANGSYNGTAQVVSGTMQLNNAASLKNTNEVLVGTAGTLDVLQSNTIAGLSNIAGLGGAVANSGTVARTLTLGGTGGASYSFSGILADGTNGNGVLSVTKSGASTQLLSGSNSYSGPTAVSSGTLQLGSAYALGTVSKTTNITLTSGTAAATVDDATGLLVGMVVLSNDITPGIYISGISGTNVTLSRAATVSSTGSATFTGATDVETAGVLDFNGQTVGEYLVDWVAGGDFTLVNSSTTAAALTTPIVNHRNLTVDGSGDLELQRVYHDVAVGRNITKNGAGTLTLSGSEGNSRYGLIVNAGTVNLNKSAGQAVVNNPLVVNGGLAKISGSGGNQINDSDGVTMNGGTFQLNGHNESIGTLSGTAGTIQNGAAATTSTLFLRSSGTHSGAISDGSGVLAITKENTGTQRLSGSLSYTGATSVTGGTLELGTSLTTSASMSVANGAALKLTGTTIGLFVPGNALTVSGTGYIDIQSNVMAVDGASVGTVTGGTYSGITGLVQSGFLNGVGGYWDGPGINSSTAAGEAITGVGVADNSVLGLSDLDGLAVSGSSILVKYTYNGDANLDGVVSGADLTKLQTGFAGSLTGWQNGDFNYDGVIGGADLTKLQTAFASQGGPLATGGGSGPGAVPEPGTFALLLGGLGMLAMRRRRA